MLFKLRAKLSSWLTKLRFVPLYYVAVPLILLASALVIRLSTGGTHLVYNVLDGRGIFPGPFMYVIFYSLRIVLCGIILSFSVFSRRLYEERLRVVLFCLTSTVLLLLEYKLIFGGVSLILEAFFALLTALCSALCVICARYRPKVFVISAFLLAVLQMVFLVQVISLAICI